MPNAATIYHNPQCGTSRNTLALLRTAGVDVEVIEYLEAPPSPERIGELARLARMSIRDLLRRKGTPFAELGLDDPRLGDDQLLEAVRRHPILLNRPIVVTGRGVQLCRPSDIVLDLLDQPPTSDVLKEEGVPVLADERLGKDHLSGLRAALEAARLPVDDIAEPGRTFFRYRTLAGHGVGHGGYELCGSDVLIRSIVVEQGRRRTGIGSNLVAILLRRAFDQGARTAWLQTMDARQVFERLGFEAVPRETAPAAILATRQAKDLCPASATLMRKPIML